MKRTRLAIAVVLLCAGVSTAWGRYCWWAGYSYGADNILCAEWQMHDGPGASQEPSCRNIATARPPYFPGKQALP